MSDTSITAGELRLSRQARRELHTFIELRGHSDLALADCLVKLALRSLDSGEPVRERDLQTMLRERGAAVLSLVASTED